MLRPLIAACLAAILAASGVRAQDPFQGLDLTSDPFTKSEMTREDVLAAVAKGTADAPADLSGKSLNVLDLSGADLSHVILRGARLNKALALQPARGLPPAGAGPQHARRGHPGRRLAPRTPPSEARSGQLVVARLGNDVTLKRLKLRGSKAELIPANPDFQTLHLDLTRDALEIEGIGVGVIRNLTAAAPPAPNARRVHRL